MVEPKLHHPTVAKCRALRLETMKSLGLITHEESCRLVTSAPEYFTSVEYNLWLLTAPVTDIAEYIKERNLANAPV